MQIIISILVAALSFSAWAQSAPGSNPGAPKPATAGAASPAANVSAAQSPGSKVTGSVAASSAAGSAPATPPPIPGTILDSGLPPEIFKEVVKGQQPLSTDQIKDLRVHSDKIKRASSTRPGGMPKAVISSVNVSMEPGTSPHVIRLSPDFVTSIVFQDATGAIWPIASRTVGNDQAFTVSDTAKKTHILTISQQEDYAVGNLTVVLEGAPTPLIFTLLSNQREMDYRLDVRAQARGPNAVTPVMESVASEPIAQELVSVLDGIPPKGAKALTVSDGSAQAWMVGKHVMLRTRMALMSPAAFKIARSPDGTAVYEIPEAPVVLAMSGGKVVSISISGY